MKSTYFNATNSPIAVQVGEGEKAKTVWFPAKAASEPMTDKEFDAVAEQYPTLRGYLGTYIHKAPHEGGGSPEAGEGTGTAESGGAGANSGAGQDATPAPSSAAPKPSEKKGK